MLRQSALWLLLLTVPVGAQQVQREPVAGHGPFSLNVVVTPGDHGKPVAGLLEKDFTVLDDGAPQRIASFRAISGPSQPTKVLIVLDAVNLGFTRLAYEREEIDRFLKANDGQLPQPTSLAIFTDTQTVIQGGYSKDGRALSEDLAKQETGLRALRRSAGFYGAEERLDMSLKTLDQLLAREAAEPGRKFVLFVSPGWPLLSGPNVDLSGKQQQYLFGEIVHFSAALQQANTTLYAVDPLGASEGPGRTFYYQSFLKGVSKVSQVQPGDLGLQVLAVQSGGLFLGSSNDIGQLLEQAYADAAARYELTYTPPPAEHANEYHRIEVRMADPHLKARTTQGYYAQP